MMRGWEGTVKTRLFTVLPRKRVLFVLNLTHDRYHVQFLPYTGSEFFAALTCPSRDAKLSHQNTEVYVTS